MKPKQLLVLILLTLSTFQSHLIFAQEKSKALTLQECFETALKNSENIKISQEEINLSEAYFTQALGSVLPKIHLAYSEFFQDSASRHGSGLDQSFIQTRKPQVGVGFTQPLFQGLREFYAIKASKLNQEQNQYKKADLERLLYGDVATAFYTIASLKTEQDSLNKIKQLIKQRLKEISERIGLGKSRDSEYAAQAAELSMIEANLEKAKGDILIAYELLGYLTGLTPQPPIKIDSPKINVGTYEEWLHNISDRSDLKAQDKNIELAKQNVKVQRSYLFPTLDLDANTWIHRSGYLNDIHWDSTLRLNVPLFNFETYGNIQEAKIKTKQLELKKEEMTRRSEKEVGRDFVNLKTSLAQLKKYQLAAQMTELSYKQQVKDYQQSLVTNLDVLQAQKSWMQALEQSHAAQVTVWTNWAKLKMSSGKIN